MSSDRFAILRRASLLRLAALLIAGWWALGGEAAAAQAMPKFAAIAYSPATGRYGYAMGHASRASAELGAIRACKSGDARTVIWCRNSWCALARSKSGNGWGAAWGSSKSAAQASALRNCPAKARYVAVTVYSGS